MPVNWVLLVTFLHHQNQVINMLVSNKCLSLLVDIFKFVIPLDCSGPKTGEIWGIVIDD